MQQHRQQQRRASMTHDAPTVFEVAGTGSSPSEEGRLPRFSEPFVIEFNSPKFEVTILHKVTRLS
jgi:hypothetical protein